MDTIQVVHMNLSALTYQHSMLQLLYAEHKRSNTRTQASNDQAGGSTQT